MVEDERASREPESGYAEFAAGESGTAKDLITIRSEQTFTVNDYVITYDNNATATATVKLYDDTEGTGAGAVTGQFESVVVDPGDEITASSIARDDVGDDVVVVVEANDGDLSIVLGGYIVTG